MTAPFEAHFEDGTVIAGVLDENGYAHIEDAPNGRFHVLFGEDARDWSADSENILPESPYSEEDLLNHWVKQNDDTFLGKNK